MTTSDLDHLRAVAEAATPDEWRVSDANEGTGSSPLWMVTNEAFHNPPADEDELWLAVEIHTGTHPDAEHIATFAPPTVLALLDRLERADEERRDAFARGRNQGFRDGFARAEKAEAAVERVREAVAMFCHGEQAYAEHVHYCVPILTALDGEGGEDRG